MDEQEDQFSWPWQHDFPPFYTLQPNTDTRSKQVEAWCSLVLAYCKQNKMYQLDLTEMTSNQLFSNNKIQRKLSTENIIYILDILAKKGHVEWSDPKAKKRCLVMWRTPEEWGKLIYDWAAGCGMMNTVCTLYELSNGDDTKGQEFYGLEKWLLLRSLQTLEKKNLAELISFDGNEGVKFFQ